LISVKPGRRRPLTEADLLKIRDQWGDDRVVNTLLWEIARLRKSVRTLFARTITLYGYIPREIIVPDDPAVDRLIDAEPAITDNEAKKLAGYDSLLTESERELKRKARETRSYIVTHDHVHYSSNAVFTGLLAAVRCSTGLGMDDTYDAQRSKSTARFSRPERIDGLGRMVSGVWFAPDVLR